MDSHDPTSLCNASQLRKTARDGAGNSLVAGNAIYEPHRHQTRGGLIGSFESRCKSKTLRKFPHRREGLNNGAPRN